MPWEDSYIDHFIERIQEAERVVVTNWVRKFRIRIVTPKIILTPSFRLSFNGLKRTFPKLGEALDAKGYEFHQVEGKRE